MQDSSEAIRGVNHAPTAPDERIVALDVLRGFAVLGILLSIVNDFGWSLQYTVHFFPDPSLFDRIWGAMHEAFIGLKFISLFSLLYGLGLGMQWARRSEKGATDYRFFVRRMSVLALFGVVNTTCFWWGEILLVYALFGAVTIAMARLKRTAILLLAITVYFAAQPIWAHIVVPSFFESLEASFHDRYPFEELTRIYRSGTFSEMASARWSEYRMLFANNNQWLRTSFLFVLTGFCIGREGLHRKFLASIDRFLPVAAVSAVFFVLGTLITLATGKYFVDQSDGLILYAVFSLWLIASLFTYIFAITWLQSKVGNKAPLIRWFSTAGRMALTNYVFAALIYSMIYQNNGLGLYGQLPIATQVPIALTLFGLEVALGSFWLKRFPCGPLEWIWRRLSYGKYE